MLSLLAPLGLRFTNTFQLPLSPGDYMAVMPPQARHSFVTDLGIAQDEARAGVVASYNVAQDTSWELWKRFCAELCQDPQLHNVSKPLALLQVFALRVRDGRCAASNKPVHAATVGKALRAVGQKISALGSPDPRLDANGSMHLLLKRQLRHYDKVDPPPKRVAPIPLEIIRHSVEMVYADVHSSLALRATADLITAAFFFLMRNGEYCYTRENEGYHPFRFCDTRFHIQNRELDNIQATKDKLMTAT